MKWFTLFLPSFVVAGCTGQTLEVGSQKTSSTPTTTSDVDHSCHDLPLTPVFGPPESMVGTWTIKTIDQGPGGQMTHATVSDTEPLMIVTFADDGTWRAAQCPDVQSVDCKFWCGAPLQCRSGTYEYERGVLTGNIASDGKRDVATTPDGLTIPNFFGTLGYANLVRVDTLPECQ
jgi:hypothetical protein